MATEKRLIDANDMREDWLENGENEYVYDTNAVLDSIDSQPTVDAVEAVQFDTLKSLVNGEWVDCKLVQEALGIDFGTGLKMFDFSRTVEWNPAPLNGQKTTIKFRVKNTEVHGRWIEKPYLLGTTRYCSICGQNYGMPHGVFNYCPNCGAKMDVGNEDG